MVWAGRPSRFRADDPVAETAMLFGRFCPSFPVRLLVQVAWPVVGSMAVTKPSLDGRPSLAASAGPAT